MKCPKCGTENNDANNFCHVCGAKLSKDSDIEKKHKSPARTQKILVVLVIVLVIICVLFALLWMYSRQANVTNEVAEQENVIDEVIEQEELSHDNTAINNGDIILSDEPIDESKNIVYDVNNLSEAQERMFGPMGALIYCYDYDSATGHKWEDAGWGTLSTLTNDFSTIYNAGTRAYGDMDDRHLILASFLKECASAMYADFDGKLPPTPSSDQIAAWGVQYQQGDYYDFGYGDRGGDTHDFYITSWIEHEDGTCSVEMQEWIWEPYSIIAIYDIDLVKNEYTASQSEPYFIYSVAGIRKNDEKKEAYLAGNPATDSRYILYDSDVHYYTESELSYYTKDELRLARNEIYARHGRKFDSEDLQEYFDSQAWYHGTIEAADFSESMLNDCEKANIKTIESVENAITQSESNATAPSNFSFVDIDGKSFIYASGVGSWGSVITIYADGTFSGEYSDWNGGGADETHPRGEEEYCEFSGKFSEPTKINDYIYSVTVEYINQTYETGTSEIIDGTLYDYTDPYGISVGNVFMIYLPGTPIEEVPEFYVNWIYRSADNAPAALNSYGLYNSSEAAVFG